MKRLARAFCSAQLFLKSEVPIVVYSKSSTISNLFYVFYSFTGCGCDENGSVGTEILVGNENKTFHRCSAIGKCKCLNNNIAGKTCNTCKPGLKPFPECNECVAEGKWGSDCTKSKWPKKYYNIDHENFYIISLL